MVTFTNNNPRTPRATREKRRKRILTAKKLAENLAWIACERVTDSENIRMFGYTQDNEKNIHGHIINVYKNVENMTDRPRNL
uniref:Uncharacterized protein n=1 Tax=Romanomermis culicivorax TaxID=13658 RepID=A0A915HWD1_ROMCU